MKKNFLKFGLAVLFAATLASCNDKQEEIASPEAGALKAAQAVETLPQIIDEDYTCTNDNLYLLDGKTFVTNGAVLKIQAGTRIEGIYKEVAEEASALIITKGSKIIAEGSETAPIVFTANTENPKVGDWGGLILLGEAPTCRGNDNIIEGVDKPTIPAGVDVTFGGSNKEDNSGILRYVRVEYAGASIGDGNEINSFTFGGVGSGTTVEYCQAYYGADDSFEFFGGTVNARYLISVAANDDNFDFDWGYQGNLQFLVAVLDADAPYTKDANGIECDHEKGTGEETPKTRPVISNLTIVGTPNGETSLFDPADESINNVLYGTRFRESTRFVLRNSVVYGYKNVIFVDDAKGDEITATVTDDVAFTNDVTKCVFADNVIGAISGANHIKGDWTPGSSNSLTNIDNMGILFPFNTRFYFSSRRPALSADDDPALTGAVFTNLDGFFIHTTYKGALSEDNYWIAKSWVKKDGFPMY